MLSEHSTRAIGLELDFRLISHFAPLSPTRFGFFFALFSLSLFEIFFPQNEKCMRFPRVRFPQLSETYSVPRSVKKKQVKWRKKEREVEKDWRKKSGYVQHRAMDDSKTEGKMEGWQMEGYESFGTLKESKRREREYAKQKYHARSNWGGTCKVD